MTHDTNADDGTEQGANDRIEELEAAVETLAERVVELENCRTGSSSAGRFISRRSVLGALGVAGLAGLGATTASADPQGQVGTQSDPLRELYTTSVESPTDTLTMSAGGYQTAEFKVDQYPPDVILGESSNGTGSGGAVGATVGGGNNNVAKGDRATISGGVNNDVDGDYATVAGGYNNKALARFGFVGGGGAVTDTNVVYDEYGTIAGGKNNTAGTDTDATNATHATVSGGIGNEATAEAATIAGGSSNEASGRYASVGGGWENTATAEAAAVAGGTSNDATQNNSIVAGGDKNTASGYHSGVFAGIGNSASGNNSAVISGNANTASGNNSLAAGQGADAAHDNVFVWADGTNSGGPFSSSSDPNGSGVTGNETFHVKASNGARFVTSAATTFLDGGGGGWSNTSTRAAKTNVEPVEPESVLEGVESLEVATWEYKDSDPGTDGGAGTVHVGPMAEDFHDAFDVGSSDDHINSINADGVAFAAIQGLAEREARTSERVDDTEERLDETDDRVAELEAENEKLRSELQELRAEVEFIQNAVVAADGGEAE